MPEDEIDRFRARTLARRGVERLPAHLGERYGIAVVAVAALDVGVFRVGRADGGPAWVARLFSEDRPLEAIAGDARILLGLEQAGFPAERCADRDPVSSLDGQGLLVTEFVSGPRPRGAGHAVAALGTLLGRLHGQPAPAARPGGAWHHLAPAGDPRAEIDAAVALLDALRPRVGPARRPLHDELREQAALADDGADLPQAFVHPDPVPVNAVAAADGRLVLVDWAGAGRGPRVWSLGPLLLAAGARDLRLVDVAVSRYRRHATLEPRELDRLEAAIGARPLMIDCWSVCMGRATDGEALDRMRQRAPLARAIARRARAIFEAGGEPASAAG